MAAAVHPPMSRSVALAPLHRPPLDASDADGPTAKGEVPRRPPRVVAAGLPPPTVYHHTSTGSTRPVRVRIYCNGDPYFRGKQVNIVANRYATFGDLLNDLTGRLPSNVMLAYGVRQIYSPVSGRRIRDVGQLRDGAAYVCAGFETFKPMKYGYEPQQQHLVEPPDGTPYGYHADRHSRTTSVDAGESSAINVLYPRRLTQPRRSLYRNQSPNLQRYESSNSVAAAAAAAATRRATRTTAAFGSSATAPAGWLTGADGGGAYGATSTAATSSVGAYQRPKVITIVKADGGQRPRQVIKTFVGRQNIKTFEQFARDVADTFRHGGGGRPTGDRRDPAAAAAGGGTTPRGGGVRLFSIGGREVVGLSDLFRADDVFIGVEHGSGEPPTNDVREICEDLYPGSSAYVDVLVRKWTKARRRNNKRYGHAFFSARPDDIAEESAAFSPKRSGRDSGVASTSPRRAAVEDGEPVAPKKTAADDVGEGGESHAAVAAAAVPQRRDSFGRRRRRKSTDRRGDGVRIDHDDGSAAAAADDNNNTNREIRESGDGTAAAVAASQPAALEKHSKPSPDAAASRLPRARRNKKPPFGDQTESRLPPIDSRWTNETPTGRETELVKATAAVHRRLAHEDDGGYSNSTRHRAGPATIGRRRLLPSQNRHLPPIEGSPPESQQQQEQPQPVNDVDGRRNGPKVRLIYTNRRDDAGTSGVSPQPPLASATTASIENTSRRHHAKQSPKHSATAGVDATPPKTVEAEVRENDNDSLAADVVDAAKSDVIGRVADDEKQTDENANDITDAKSGATDRQERKDKRQTPRPPTNGSAKDAATASTTEEKAEDGVAVVEQEAAVPDAASSSAAATISATKSDRRRSVVVFKSPLERQVSTVGRITDRYEMGRQLGDGNFAVVHHCRHRDTGREYAMKIVDKAKMRGKEAMVENEIAITKACRHPNIVKLYEEYETKNEIYLVMELVKGGDLFDTIAQSVKFSEPEAARMVLDMAQALFYLHSLNIVHRDLKPENVLVHRNRDGGITLKLGDFGLAMEVREPIFTICGTPTYVAPEILKQSGYGLEIDMWALGVILYILLCGFPPFRSTERRQSELFESIKSGQFEFLSPYWDGNSKMAKSLISRLLVVNPRGRFKAIDVLCDPFILTVGGSLPASEASDEVRQNVRGELDARAKQYRVSFKYPSSLKHG